MIKFKKFAASIVASALASLLIFSGCQLHVIDDPQSSKESSSQSSGTTVTPSTPKTTSDTSAPTDEITPAMWKVTDSSGNYIYMMGSIHAGDEAVDHMPGYFETIYAKCDAIAVEADITVATSDLSLSMEILKSMKYDDDTKIYDHIPKETYDNAVAILKENNLYINLYDNYNASLWSSLMESAALKQSGLDTNKGVDSTIIKRAKNDGKEVLEVESIQFQLDLLNSISDELNALLLEQYTYEGAFDRQVEAVKQLYSHWKTGTLNEENINGEDISDQAAEVSLTEEQQKLLEDYNNNLLVERNKGMADKAEEYMNSDQVVLLIVGAAHFYGDDGILQLMKDKGCTVTPITAKDAELLESSAQQSSEAEEPDNETADDETLESLEEAA